jgi:hypothetical protein
MKNEVFIVNEIISATGFPTVLSPHNVYIKTSGVRTMNTPKTYRPHNVYTYHVPFMMISLFFTQVPRRA